MNDFTNPNAAPPAWPTAAPAPDTRTAEQKFHDALRHWQQTKERLDVAKEQEAEARQIAFDLGFADWAKEGTNNLPLGNGYVAKGVLKMNYNLVPPVGSTKDKVTAVDDVVDDFAKISPNEGTFIAERLFKWKPEMSVTEYRLLCERAENPEDVAAVKMLAALNTILEIKPGLPTLEIVEPKSKGKR